LAVAATAPVLGTPGAGRTRFQQGFAGVLVVVGWAMLGAGIHALGRAPEE